MRSFCSDVTITPRPTPPHTAWSSVQPGGLGRTARQMAMPAARAVGQLRVGLCVGKMPPAVKNRQHVHTHGGLSPAHFPRCAWSTEEAERTKQAGGRRARPPQRGSPRNCGGPSCRRACRTALCPPSAPISTAASSCRTPWAVSNSAATPEGPSEKPRKRWPVCSTPGGSAPASVDCRLCQATWGAGWGGEGGPVGWRAGGREQTVHSVRALHFKAQLAMHR